MAVNASLLEDEVEKLSKAIGTKKEELPAIKEKLQTAVNQIREKNKALKETEAVVKQNEERCSSLKAVLNKSADKINRFKEMEVNFIYK